MPASSSVGIMDGMIACYPRRRLKPEKPLSPISHYREYSTSSTEGFRFTARHIVKKVGTDIVLMPLPYLPTC